MSPLICNGIWITTSVSNEKRIIIYKFYCIEYVDIYKYDCEYYLALKQYYSTYMYNFDCTCAWPTYTTSILKCHFLKFDLPLRAKMSSQCTNKKRKEDWEVGWTPSIEKIHVLANWWPLQFLSALRTILNSKKNLSVTHVKKRDVPKWFWFET